MGVAIELVTTAERPTSDPAVVGVRLPGAVNHATGHPTSQLLMPGRETADVPARSDAPATMTDDLSDVLDDTTFAEGSLSAALMRARRGRRSVESGGVVHNHAAAPP